MAHRGLRLGYLALMVWEHQVHAASVDVEHLAQILASHGSAFAMPTRESVAPRRGPAHDVFGLSFLPQGEIGLVVFLAYASQFTALVLDVLQRATAQDSVFEFLVVSLDIEIDRSVRLIGKAVVENLLNQLLLFDDVPCGMRLDRGAQHVQRIHILMIAVGVVLCYLHRLQLFQSCLLGNLVFALVGIVLQMTYIRDVTHVPYFIAKVFQVTEQQVEGDGRTGMTQMGIAINGRTTDIHAHMRGVDGLETLFLTSQRIVNY